MNVQNLTPDNEFTIHQQYLDLLHIKQKYAEFDPIVFLNKVSECEHKIKFLIEAIQESHKVCSELFFEKINNILIFLNKSISDFRCIGAVNLVLISTELLKEGEMIDSIKFSSKEMRKKKYELISVTCRWLLIAEVTCVALCIIFQSALISGCSIGGKKFHSSFFE